MADLYLNLSYDDYKRIEKQMKEFAETSHGEGSDYYHKSFRLRITNELNLEFHGPNVKARQREVVAAETMVTTVAQQTEITQSCGLKGPHSTHDFKNPEDTKWRHCSGNEGKA